MDKQPAPKFVNTYSIPIKKNGKMYIFDERYKAYIPLKNNKL